MNELDDILPTIAISEDIKSNADDAIEALAREPVADETRRVYQRGGRLVHLVTHDPPGEATRTVIKSVELATLTERLSAAAEWVRIVQKNGDTEARPAKPPKDVVSAVLARGEWPRIPHLVDVVDTPVLRPNGTILQSPGYDSETGLLYKPNATFPTVAESPTWFDAVAAARDLSEVVADFPFARPADRSVWLAFLLTLFARHAVKGNTPLLCLDSSVRGSGKGMIAATLGCIATGRDLTLTTMPEGEDELRKKITAYILEGERAVHFDNCTDAIGGPSIEALATAPAWSDRILGKSEVAPKLPKKIVVVFSGNNLRYKGDTARRVVPLRLVPKVERPEDREGKGFAHWPLLPWVLENRPHLVHAALTILRAWFAAESPDADAPAYGSFDEWSRLIVNVVRWIGWEDPMAVREGIESANDTSRQALEHIVLSWQGAFGQKRTTAKKIVEALRDDGLTDLYTAFTTVVGNDSLTARNVGEALAKAKDRIVEGRAIRLAGYSGGVASWECERVA